MSLKDRVVNIQGNGKNPRRLVRANPGPPMDAVATRCDMSSIDMTVEIYEDCLSYRDDSDRNTGDSFDHSTRHCHEVVGLNTR